MVDKFVSRMHKHVRLITVFAVVAALFVCAVFVCVKPTTARADGGIQGSDYFTTDAEKVNGENGVTFQANANKTWQATINGVFTDDFSMEFTAEKFWASHEEQPNSLHSVFKFVIRVANASDVFDYFDIVYVKDERDGLRTSAFVSYKSKAYCSERETFYPHRLDTYPRSGLTDNDSWTNSYVAPHFFVPDEKPVFGTGLRI